MPNLGQIRRFLEPCDLEIWRMTLRNNRAPPLSIVKLYTSLLLLLLLVFLWDKYYREWCSIKMFGQQCPSSLNILYQLGNWKNPDVMCIWLIIIDRKIVIELLSYRNKFFYEWNISYFKFFRTAFFIELMHCTYASCRKFSLIGHLLVKQAWFNSFIC